MADQPAQQTQPMAPLSYQPAVHHPHMQQAGSSGKGKVWIVVSLVVLLVVALGTVLALTVFGGDDDDETSPTTSSEEPSDEPSSEEPSASEPTEEPTDEPTDEPDGLLSLGESTEVGDYVVTVDGVQLDANDVIADINEFNEPPKGQYVLLDITGVYEGNKTGTAWLDLQASFIDSAGKDHPSYECLAVVPNPGYELPPLRNGDSASFQYCFDVPPDQIDGGHVLVRDSLDFEDQGARWAIG